MLMNLLDLFLTHLLDFQIYIWTIRKTILLNKFLVLLTRVTKFVSISLNHFEELLIFAFKFFDCLSKLLLVYFEFFNYLNESFYSLLHLLFLTFVELFLLRLSFFQHALAYLIHFLLLFSKFLKINVLNLCLTHFFVASTSPWCPNHGF